VFGLAPIPPSMALLYGLIPAAAFSSEIRSFGRPMFVFLTLVMFLLATTELGVDGWMPDIMGSVLKDPDTGKPDTIKGTAFLVYTSAIMFGLRFFAGPIVHRISPLGLLAACAALASVGLFWLGSAGTALTSLIAAATIYGVGKTFFWPTTLGVVSEQYPRGGALLLNAISGVGMIAIGTIGGPAIGTLQDRDFTEAVAQELPEVHEELSFPAQGLFFDYTAIDQTKFAELSEADQKLLADLQPQTKQHALRKIAVLPLIMCGCYLILIAYFRSRGGYQAQVLTGHAAQDEKFTGGTMGPGEG
jgi:hypothetical protein